MRHGKAHHDRQRQIAVLMVASGLLRVVVWAALLSFYLVGIGTVKHLFVSVSFVALLSVLALLLTDWAQVAASLAQLSAGRAHEDAEAARTSAGTASVNVKQVEVDIMHLAELEPGPDAVKLAASIRRRLSGRGA